MPTPLQFVYLAVGSVVLLVLAQIDRTGWPTAWFGLALVLIAAGGDDGPRMLFRLLALVARRRTPIPC